MHFLLVPYLMLSITFLVQFQTRKNIAARTGLVVTAGLTLIMMFLAITFRPPVGDSWRYYLYFLDLHSMGLMDALSYRDSDFLYALLNWVVGKLGDSESLLFSATLVVYLGVFIAALHRVAGPVGTASLIVCYSAFPFFVAFAANGLRQGLALVFLLMAYVFFYTKKPKVAWVWLLLAPFWHSGAWLGVGVAALHWAMCRFVRKESARLCLVLCSLFAATALSASGLNESLLSRLPDIITLQQRHEIYFTEPGNLDYRSGFRIDFLLFSILPLVSAWMLRHRAPTFAHGGSGWWLSLYLSLNILYHLFSFVPYADRFAAFSWFLMPLVVFLQILETKRRKLLTGMVALVTLINVVMLQFYTGKFIEPPVWW